MAEFKFSCPQCSQNIRCDSGYSGTQINCPACQKPIVVPPASPSPAPPPIPASPQTASSPAIRRGTPALATARQPFPAKSCTLRNVLIIVAVAVVLAGLVIGGWFGYSKIKLHSKLGKLPPGLVALWSGDGNPNDSAGGNNGKLSGNVTYRKGRIGQAFSFDGKKDWVDVGNPASLQLQDFTITAWIKRSSTSSVSDNNHNAMIFCHGTGGYGLFLNPAGGLAMAKIGTKGIAPDKAITDTNWHHLAVTKSGSTVAFYVDGVAYPAPAFDQTFVFSRDAFIGGKNQKAWECTFAGLIDEVGVYNRALSASDIQTIYEAK
jgi:hypothetical protein